MLGLLVLLGFWLAIAILIVLPLIIVFALGSFIAEELGLNGLAYYLFMIMFYLIILGVLILI